jgi:DNA repair protein RAD16
VCDPAARQATIDRFTSSADVTVFLISLKAGGVALNLTEASRVFLMDSWWNPAVEYQAMDVSRASPLRTLLFRTTTLTESVSCLF